ncbi:LPS-assembly lipoprotein LptE [Legionella impletisoli]|uniref:LPS-assembly lipoprotein LptE n=1 Tax=Legionella impletisoli TaxID=343510 RepID=A0A917JMH3_9GAMM|nr:LPS assembly lipoprotein LptE [Legionella impletisoli]GGI76822.1 LPS-assembly lipoprotein LptE [Legionella impletisoli]
MKTTASKIITTLLIVFHVGMMSGCGFHLRGLTDVPKWLDKVAIITPDNEHYLTPILKNQLEANCIRVCSEPAGAKYWLIILSETFQEHIVSVSSTTTPRQYQIIYRIRFKLQEVNGKEVIPERQVEISRQVTINNDRILGSNYEETLTKNEMRQEAAALILNRISKYSETFKPRLH